MNPEDIHLCRDYVAKVDGVLRRVCPRTSLTDTQMVKGIPTEVWKFECLVGKNIVWLKPEDFWSMVQ